MNRKKYFIICFVLLAELVLCGSTFAAGAEAPVAGLEAVKEELQTNINIVWTCIAAFWYSSCNQASQWSSAALPGPKMP